MCTKIHVHVGTGELTVTNICTPTQINKNNIKFILYPHCIILNVGNWSNLNIYLWEKEFIMVICYIAISEIFMKNLWESLNNMMDSMPHFHHRSGLKRPCFVLFCFPWKFELWLEVKNSFVWLYFYAYDSFACMYVCMPCACLVPSAARKGHQVPWNWSYRQLSYHMGGGKRTASTLNYLSHLSSPLEAKMFWMFLIVSVK